MSRDIQEFDRSIEVSANANISELTNYRLDKGAVLNMLGELCLPHNTPNIHISAELCSNSEVRHTIKTIGMDEVDSRDWVTHKLSVLPRAGIYNDYSDAEEKLVNECNRSATACIYDISEHYKMLYAPDRLTKAPAAIAESSAKSIGRIASAYKWIFAGSVAASLQLQNMINTPDAVSIPTTVAVPAAVGVCAMKLYKRSESRIKNYAAELILEANSTREHRIDALAGRIQVVVPDQLPSTY